MLNVKVILWKIVTNNFCLVLLVTSLNSVSSKLFRSGSGRVSGFHYYTSVGFQIVIKSEKKILSLIGSSFYKCIFKFHVVCSDQENIQVFGLAQIGFGPDPILYSKPFFGSFSWHGRGLRTSIPVVFICTRQKQLLDHQLKEEVDGSVR